MVYRRAALALTRTRALSTTRSGVPATVLDEKLRGELRGLHESEPERWTATTLAARFGVARENVSAVLRLARLRKEMSDEHLESAKALENAWLELEPRERRPITARPPIPAPASAAEGETEDDEDFEDDEEPDDYVGSTETADWVRGKIAEGKFETIRKSTFAFIEVGKGSNDENRAVWLRDGSTGLLRAPTKEERRSILRQPRIIPE